MTIKVSRQEMIEAVRKNVNERYAALKYTCPHSYAWLGHADSLRRAQSLLIRLERGEKPSTKEVVAYFGKGARFNEES